MTQANLTHEFLPSTPHLRVIAYQSAGITRPARMNRRESEFVKSTLSKIKTILFPSPRMKYSRSTLLLLILFWPFTALVLLCDSRLVAEIHPNGQFWSNLLAPVFLLLLMTRLSPQRQLMVALFVPLSALGETIFSLVFGLYEYRFHAVPVYVPFGHSILMSVGLMLSDTNFVQQNMRRVQIGLLAFHGALILGALVFFGDTLSTLWAVIFVLLLKKRVAQPFYLILGVLVLFVEILGTRWGVWVWGPEPFGIFRTTNPPVGAFTCYVIGDLLAMKIAVKAQALWARRRATIIDA